MGNIGLPRSVVRLDEYSPEWRNAFEKEKEFLLQNFPDEILEVSHGGSTSVPGMLAKPIIDMFAVVTSLADAEKMRDRLERLGYHYRGEEGVSGRLLYAKGPEEKRTHNLNLVEKSSDEWKNHISLREYYIRHPDVADEYIELKKSLAKKYPDDRVAYRKGKKDFIGTVLESARAEGL